MRLRAVCAGLLFAVGTHALAQQPSSSLPPEGGSSLSVRSNLVVVPAMVKTRRGEVVFGLDASNFVVTDDGVPQRVRLEQDAHEQPLALVVVAQTGGNGSAHLEDYRDLGAVLDAIVGAVPHRVAVVSFDSTPQLRQDFSADTDAAAKTLGILEAGDQGAGILDALNFATVALAKQPREYRRAILLLSETVDAGSQTSLDATLKAIDDSNTAIYTFAFSSGRTALHHEGAKLPNPFKTTKYSDTPYKAGGCMSREPGADPDAHGSRPMQALDCAEDLLPPLRLARMAYIAASEGMRRDVPQTVARLTGGESFRFKDAKGLRQQLIAIANDVHNSYVLTFQPAAPHTGMHALAVTVADRNDLVIRARDAYWIDAPETSSKQP